MLLRHRLKTSSRNGHRTRVLPPAKNGKPPSRYASIRTLCETSSSGSVHVGIRPDQALQSLKRSRCSRIKGGQRSRDFNAVARTGQSRCFPLIAGAAVVDAMAVTALSRLFWYVVFQLPQLICFVASLLHCAAAQSMLTKSSGSSRKGRYASPVFHMDSISTASLRATATTAFFFAILPPRLASASP